MYSNKSFLRKLKLYYTYMWCIGSKMRMSLFRYGRKGRQQKENNFGMIMKLIKYVAESDKLRHLLNGLVTRIKDDTLSDFIVEELMQYPGLVSTGFTHIQLIIMEFHQLVSNRNNFTIFLYLHDSWAQHFSLFWGWQSEDCRYRNTIFEHNRSTTSI